jgi:ArsR family transcriptional regulator, arsenate/arsenite/antimonite-responsive transcriptional repressor
MKFTSRCHMCFAALSTPARVEIVKLLQVNERMAVLQIAKHFKLTQPTITHHLRYLEKAKIVKSQKEGKRIYYFLSPVCSQNECQIF